MAQIDSEVTPAVSLDKKSTSKTSSTPHRLPARSLSKLSLFHLLLLLTPGSIASGLVRKPILATPPSALGFDTPLIPDVKQAVSDEDAEENPIQAHWGKALSEDDPQMAAQFMAAVKKEIQIEEGNLKKILLEDATRANKVEIVKALLAQGADCDAISPESGEVPLITAIKLQHDGVVDALLENKCDVNVIDKAGMTPLYRAVETENYLIAKKLIERGADVNAGKGKPLYLAIWKNLLSVVRLLVKSGAEINTSILELIDESSNKFPVKPEIIEYLKKALEWGEKTRTGRISQMIDTDDFSTFKALIEEELIDLNKHDPNGETLLTFAVKLGKINFIEGVLSYGANPNLPTRDGDIPLTIALIKENIEVALLLLDKIPTIIKDPYNVSALSYAAQLANPLVLKKILDKGADPNERHTELGITPLFYAVLVEGKVKANLKCVKMLVEAGADIYVQNNEGRTLLDIAKMRGEQDPIFSYLNEVRQKKGTQPKKAVKSSIGAEESWLDFLQQNAFWLYGTTIGSAIALTMAIFWDDKRNKKPKIQESEIRKALEINDEERKPKKKNKAKTSVQPSEDKKSVREIRELKTATSSMTPRQRQENLKHCKEIGTAIKKDCRDLFYALTGQVLEERTSLFETSDIETKGGSDLIGRLQKGLYVSVGDEKIGKRQKRINGIQNKITLLTEKSKALQDISDRLDKLALAWVVTPSLSELTQGKDTTEVLLDDFKKLKSESDSLARDTRSEILLAETLIPAQEKRLSAPTKRPRARRLHEDDLPQKSKPPKVASEATKSGGEVQQREKPKASPPKTSSGSAEKESKKNPHPANGHMGFFGQKKSGKAAFEKKEFKSASFEHLADMAKWYQNFLQKHRADVKSSTYFHACATVLFEFAEATKQSLIAQQLSRGEDFKSLLAFKQLNHLRNNLANDLSLIATEGLDKVEQACMEFLEMVIKANAVDEQTQRPLRELAFNKPKSELLVKVMTNQYSVKEGKELPAFAKIDDAVPEPKSNPGVTALTALEGSVKIWQKQNKPAKSMGTLGEMSSYRFHQAEGNKMRHQNSYDLLKNVRKIYEEGVSAQNPLIFTH
ncbi:MAG: ankyrin repeat domain-containing protein [Gammaproteobacteria bacterium]